MLFDVIYDRESKESKIPIVFSKRANAPEKGTVFTSKVLSSKNQDILTKARDGRVLSFYSGKEDFLLNAFKNYTGYIKKSHEKPKLELKIGEYYRFMVVAGPYTKENHNYYYAIVLRNIGKEENHEKNIIDPQTSLFIKRLGEFLMGLGWDRKTKKAYSLNYSQKNWDWFYKNFK